MKSVLQNHKECWVSECKRCDNLHSHHVFEGTANRRKSEQYGLKVWLCPYHHNMSDYGVHFNKTLDRHIKQIAQAYFETHIGDRELFRKEFGKSFL